MDWWATPLAMTISSESRCQCFRIVLRRFEWRESTPSNHEDKLARSLDSPWDDETSVHLTFLWFVFFSEEGDADLVTYYIEYFCRVFYSGSSGRVHVIHLLACLNFLSLFKCLRMLRERDTSCWDIELDCKIQVSSPLFFFDSTLNRCFWNLSNIISGHNITPRMLHRSFSVLLWKPVAG